MLYNKELCPGIYTKSTILIRAQYIRHITSTPATYQCYHVPIYSRIPDPWPQKICHKKYASLTNKSIHVCINSSYTWYSKIYMVGQMQICCHILNITLNITLNRLENMPKLHVKLETSAYVNRKKKWDGKMPKIYKNG